MSLFDLELNSNLLALEQLNKRLLARVCLSKHRRSCLVQDLEAGELGTLRRHIHINNTAIGGLEIDRVYFQKILRETNATRFSTVLSSHVSDILQSHLYNFNKFIRIFVIQGSTRRTRIL